MLLLVLGLSSGAFAAPVATLNASGGNVAGDGLRVTVEADGRIQIWREGTGQVYMGEWPSISNTLSLGATTYWNSGGSPTVPVVVDAPVVGATESVAVHETLPDTSTLTIWYEYAAPDEYIDVTVEYAPLASNEQAATYAHFFDTYLSGGDNGPAYYDPEGAVGVTKAGLYEVFLQVDQPWAWYYSGPYYTPWNLVQNGGHLDGTLDYNFGTDNGIGVQWDLGVPTSPVTFRYRIAFTTDVTVIVPPVSTGTGTGTGTTTATSTSTGTYVPPDADGDGVPDALDVCAGFNDNDDLDSDTIPDGCDSDRDGDGMPEGVDCDESDPTVGAALLWYMDADGDGYGNRDTEFSTCAPDAGWVTDKHDCDDTDAVVNPAAEETCLDLVDFNCDGSIPYDDADADGVCGPVDACPGFDDAADFDGDGRADGCDACPTDVLNDADGDEACAGDDICTGHDDREDADADLVPDGCDACPDAAFEEPDDLDADGLPDDCDGDVDGDEVAAGEDCDDFDATALDARAWFLDHDRDGYGDEAFAMLSCDAPPYFIADGSDCDDGMARVHPGATETCTDEFDVDCDGFLSFDDPDYDGACSDMDPCPSRYGFVCGPPPVDSGTATATYSETNTATGTASTTATATATATSTVTATSTATSTGTGTYSETDTATDPAVVCEDTGPTVVTVYVDEEDPEVYAGGWSCDTTGSDGIEIVAFLLGAIGVYSAVRRPRDERPDRDE